MNYEEAMQSVRRGNTMNFGEAIKLIKSGCLVAREGWNGKDMFIFMGFPRVGIHKKTEGGEYRLADAGETYRCNYSGPSICMRTAQNDIVVGWLASQTDMMANDWVEINTPVYTGTVTT